MAKDFPLGDILSITDGHLVSRDRIDGVYRILNYMTGESLFTHALPRASREARPILLEQHPQLADVVFPDAPRDGGEWDEASVNAWLSEQEATYGETLPVEPMRSEDHTSIDPISELRMLRPDADIIVVEPPDSEGV